MKITIRWWSRLAFVASVGLTSLIACSSDHADVPGQEQHTGSLALALQTTSNTGSVYRLRNATFQIMDARTGETVQFLFSEDSPAEAPEISTTLNRSDYTVTLLPGWFLERISQGNGGGGGFGGTFGGGGFPGGGFGGTFTTAGTSTGGSFSIGGEPPIAGGAGGEFADQPAPPPPKAPPGKSPKPPVTPPGEAGGSPGDIGGGFGGEPPIFPPTGGTSSGGTTSIGGAPPTGEGVVVDAQLVSDAVQFFTIFGGDDEFVFYSFKVGGEIIDFNRGRVHVGISVDDSQACQVPDGVTLPERVLIESNTAAVASVRLSDAFAAIANNGSVTGDPTKLYQEIYDSYATAANGLLPDATHCGDEQTNGANSLNGFPIDCDRAEAAHVKDMDKFFATAFSNRIDLAPQNGAHCGQQRMIFANNSQGRAFMILEAQIPNPHPELGIDGCRPLAQFWMDQNSNPDAASRGALLAQAFLKGGVPGLADAGFGPFFTPENFTVGSGQIRTNQFDSFPWTLREFKLATDGGELRAMPFPVAESPNGALWNEDSGLAQGDACRQSFLSGMDGLLTDDMNAMSFVVDAACKDAESRNDFSEDYPSQMTPGLADQIQHKLTSIGSSLSATDIASRARFAGSCIGCHNEAQNSSLGDNVFAPPSPDFPQVQDSAGNCADGESGQCFTTSPALKTVFLPSRLQVMSNLLGVPIVPNPCGNGGGGGSGGGGNVGGFAGMSAGGGFPIPTGGSGGSFGMGQAGSGVVPDPLPEPAPAPAPVVVIDLPPASEPALQMQQEDAAIRKDFGKKTLGGKSPKSTH